MDSGDPDCRQTSLTADILRTSCSLILVDNLFRKVVMIKTKDRRRSNIPFQSGQNGVIKILPQKNGYVM